MRIMTNTASLNAQANGAQTNNNLTSSLEKLSSGLKINKAADDASGMAIADKLRMQASSVGQGISNANSGNALITIADKAMGEQSKILDTIKTKLLQASTSTTSAEGREAIRKDVQKLLQQINNISEQTTYNGVNLLNEKGADFSFTVGEKSTDIISMQTAYAINTEGLGSSDRDFANTAVIRNDSDNAIVGLAIEGEAESARIEVANSGGGLGVTFTASQGASVHIAAEGVTQLNGGAEGMILRTTNEEEIAFLNKQADLNTTDGLVKLANGTYSLSAAGTAFANGEVFNFTDLTVSAGTAGGTFTLASASTATIEKVSGSDDIAINSATKAIVDGDTADGIAFGDQVMVTEGALAIQADAPATNGMVAINTVAATTESGKAELTGTIASDEVVKSISLWNSSGPSTVKLSTTDGDTAAALEAAGLTAGVDGTYTWTTSSLVSSELSFGDDGIMISNLTFEGLSKNTLGSEQLFIETAGAVTVENLGENSGNTGADANIQNGIGVQVADVTATGVSASTLAVAFSASTVSSGLGASNLSGLMSIGEGGLSAETAKNFMSVIDDAMTQLNTVRSDFGSTQGQLKVAIDNMMVTQVNLKAAESVIRDVDYAAESANFNKQNIIAQAGTYAMSQANAMQQNVLRLLQ